MAVERLELEREPAAGRWRLTGLRNRRRASQEAELRQVVARRHRPRDAAVRRALAASDAVAVAASLAVALLLHPMKAEQFAYGLLAIPLWIIVFKAYGLYDRESKRISYSTVDDVPWVFHAVLLGSLLMIAYYRLLPTSAIALSDLAIFSVACFVTVTALRIVARKLSMKALGFERVLLIGDGPEMLLLARKLRSHPEYGVEPVGLVCSAGSHATNGDTPPVLADVSGLDLTPLVEQHRVDRLVVAHQDFEEGSIFDLLRGARELGVKVSVLPQLFDALGPSVEVDDVEGITVLGVNPPVLPRSSRLLKRTMDLAGSTILLVVTAPLLVLIAIAVRLDSAGPVIFRQERIGRGGRRFRLLKFRTMVADAEARREELLAQSKDPGWLHLDHDPRITRVGRLLRLSSLDELPQLLNVLKGEMSLVGPRPLEEAEDRQLEGWRRSRIDLTPGITGLWQVLGRTSIPFEEMIKLDYLYVTNWSLWSDIRLILRTLPVVLLRKGAN